MVRIGLIAPFEGLGRPLGYAVLPAVKAAIAEANADGRLGRYRVALVVLNDDLDPAAAAAQAQALAQDGPAGTGAEQAVMAVLGPFDSATAQAAAPILARAGIPALIAAPASGLPAGVRSLCPTSSQIAAALQSRAPRPELCPENVTVGTGACYTAADAAAAADDLRRWRAGGWQGTLFGGPDLFRPWLIQRGGEAAEGTVAAACAPVGMAVASRRATTPAWPTPPPWPIPASGLCWPPWPMTWPATAGRRAPGWPKRWPASRSPRAWPGTAWKAARGSASARVAPCTASRCGTAIRRIVLLFSG